VDPAQLRVIPFARVDQVLFNDQKEAFGVKAQIRGKNITLKAKKEVILAAGKKGHQIEPIRFLKDFLFESLWISIMSLFISLKAYLWTKGICEFTFCKRS